MRVRVRRERTVLLWRLIEADPAAHAVVELAKSAALGGIRSAIDGGGEVLLHGEQQLRHHVPVDAAEAFEAEHGARAAGKHLVIEYAFEQVVQRRAGRLDVVAVGLGQGV